MHDGWHCLHLYYRVCQTSLAQLSESQRAAGRDELLRLLDPARQGAPARLQTSVVSGHKADLALMIMDPDPLVIDSVRQSIRTLGDQRLRGLITTYNALRHQQRWPSWFPADVQRTRPRDAHAA